MTSTHLALSIIGVCSILAGTHSSGDKAFGFWLLATVSLIGVFFT